MSLELVAVLIAAVTLGGPSLRWLYRLVRTAEEIRDAVQEIRPAVADMRQRIELLEGQAEIIFAAQRTSWQRIRGIEEALRA